MSQSAPRLRSLYRQFLRELPLPAPSTTGAKASILSHPSLVKSRIRSSFVSPPNPISPTMVEAKRQELEQIVQYLRAQRTYATLVERYNPGANMEEEERVRLTARRVGMDLPVEYEVRPWGTGGSRGGAGESER